MDEQGHLFVSKVGLIYCYIYTVIRIFFLLQYNHLMKNILFLLYSLFTIYVINFSNMCQNMTKFL